MAIWFLNRHPHTRAMIPVGGHGMNRPTRRGGACVAQPWMPFSNSNRGKKVLINNNKNGTVTGGIFAACRVIARRPRWASPSPAGTNPDVEIGFRLAGFAGRRALSSSKFGRSVSSSHWWSTDSEAYHLGDPGSAPHSQPYHARRWLERGDLSPPPAPSVRRSLCPTRRPIWAIEMN
jgi:hypothetical protein